RDLIVTGVQTCALPIFCILPVAAAFFVFGYVLQSALINPFVTRPEHSQFMLLVAVAIILVNALLMMFGPDARNVQVDYQLESFEIGRASCRERVERGGG